MLNIYFFILKIEKIKATKTANTHIILPAIKDFKSMSEINMKNLSFLKSNEEIVTYNFKTNSQFANIQTSEIYLNKNIKTKYKPLTNININAEFYETEITRPSSPDAKSEEHYYFLINSCIKTEMISEMPIELIEKIKYFTNRDSLAIKYFKVAESYLTEVKYLYNWSIKKSILDYLLRDDQESKRLRIDLKKVIFYFNFKIN